MISGQDFPPEKYNNEGNGIPYIIGASNIENERLLVNRWTKTPSVLSFENDLLVVCKGAGVGKMAFNNVGTVHIARQIQAIRNFSQNIVTPFIKIIVLSSIGNIVSKANGLIPGLKRELLLSMFFPFPPYNEQQRIVDEIQHWFSLIDIIENNKVNLQNTIKQAKAKVLDLAIHGKLVPQDPDDEPAVELLKRINPKAEIITDNGHYQKIVPFEVPNKWKWCKLKDICTFLSRGKSPKYKDEDGTYPVFAQKCNLKDGGISLEQVRFLDPDTLERWDEKYKLRNGDVLINSTGTGTVGRTRLFTEDCLDKYPFVVPDSHVSVVRTHVDVVSEFVYSYISSAHIQQYIEDNLAGSTNQKELYIGVLEEMDFPLPPLTEQKRIVSKIRSIFAQLDTIVATL